MPDLSLRCTAFAGPARIASGELRHVALKARQAFASGRRVLVFEDASGRQVDLPLELSEGELLRLLSAPVPMADPVPAPARGPGRPKLGVVAREVTLLPRHWDWLAAQPGGASVALRKLVEDARKVAGGNDRRRAAQESAYRFMQAMAGDLPGYEDATRALFAGDVARFEERTATWPEDVRDHAALLAADAFVH
ncbi:DUF2239 family protein [Pseudoluteimonas lycopersici]|uniref:DUF2239 family protein n=1 Tax=Pseudoluteimonas lycopersici TaxID=1324796 RepID=A0A516V661_9GAMM|nr:DUF2239 family protein [Lysobacter lycopersici]QDQ74008.1 DUF2239 family protein [Lysobacter lycopersici]